MKRLIPTIVVSAAAVLPWAAHGHRAEAFFVTSKINLRDCRSGDGVLGENPAATDLVA